MKPKRLVLFVEGEGDETAVPIAVQRVMTALNAWDALALVEQPFRVRHVFSLSANGFKEWKRYLKAALRKPAVGAILLVLDGDAKIFEGQPFCAATVARKFADAARDVGAGTTFSVAVVFALQEFESWLIAGVESLAGKKLSDGRTILPEALKAPAGDLEVSPRDAKGWLRRELSTGYRETVDQCEFTRLVDFDLIRQRGMRSFVRFEHSVQQLVTALRNNSPIASPCLETHE